MKEEFLYPIHQQRSCPDGKADHFLLLHVDRVPPLL